MPKIISLNSVASKTSILTTPKLVTQRISIFPEEEKRTNGNMYTKKSRSEEGKIVRITLRKKERFNDTMQIINK